MMVDNEDMNIIYNLGERNTRRFSLKRSWHGAFLPLEGEIEIPRGLISKEIRLIIISIILFFLLLFILTMEELLLFCKRGGVYLVDSPNQKSFLIPQNMMGESLTILHDSTISSILLRIILIVFFIRIYGFLSRKTRIFLSRRISIEMVWIILPMVILLIIGAPSLFLLYQIEDIRQSPKKRLKITGLQWYWTYEVGGGEVVEVYKEIEEEDSSWGGDCLSNFRTSRDLVLRFGQRIRMIVTARDVIHSWALPSLFIKMDAIPGRLNQIDTFLPPQQGSYYGQCRELCGVNHRFIPISLISS